MSDKAEKLTPGQIGLPGREAQTTDLGPVSDLEAALNAGSDQARDALARAGTQVEALTQKTRRALSAGATSSEFNQLNAVLNACSSAKEILVIAAHSVEHAARMQPSKRS
ncbi:hypothetical protein [Ottowia thiooxydans]|uniref:Uncharacterized protein n=1 Tax=Ottowia thiooxydans TaxID=219182 RepID=A0ABV2QH34_9BURK